MKSTREHIARGCFSALAGCVFLACAAEWTLWATEQRRYWKLIVAAGLAMMATFEAVSIWKRVDKLLLFL